MSPPTAAADTTPLQRHMARLNDHDGPVRPAEIAIGVIIGRTSEFFDFFVYAIASVLVFPRVVFPYVDATTGTLYSFALFSIAFVARPFGTLLFIAADDKFGRNAKLILALFLLGGSTMSLAFLPGYAEIGVWSAWLLAIFRLLQGLALGGVWDGLPSLLALNAPQGRRGWYAMVPQLGAPLGLIVAAGLFAFLMGVSSPQDFLEWGWRYPFFVAYAINAVALFARLRLVATPEFQTLFESRALQPAPVRETFRFEGRTLVLGAFAPLASFAMFHLMTVFPLSYVTLFEHEQPIHFLLVEMQGAAFCVLAVLGSGMLADRFGRRTVLGTSAVLIGAYSGFAPQLLDAGRVGQSVYMLLGFVILGLAFGQSSGAVNSSFTPARRYTGAAFTSDFAWLVGAAFAPLAALWLSTQFGLWSVGAYLLSGAICTLAALGINREWGQRLN
jgi:MFS family permease